MGIWGGGYMSAIGGIIGDEISASSQQQTNAAMLAQQKQMEGWQEQMSNTAMQRRVADLNAAGLNPMLAIGQGGASTPGIAPVSLGSPGASFGNLGSQLAQAGQQASMTRQTGSNVDLQSTQGKLMDAQTAKAMADTVTTLGADTNVKNATVAKLQSDMMVNQAQADRWNVQNQLDAQQIAVAHAQGDKIEAEIPLLFASKSQAEAQTHLLNIQSIGAQLNNNQLREIMPDVLSTARANQNAAWTNVDILDSARKAAQFGLPKSAAEGTFYSGGFGAGATLVEHLFNLAHVGANLTK